MCTLEKELSQGAVRSVRASELREKMFGIGSADLREHYIKENISVIFKNHGT